MSVFAPIAQEQLKKAIKPVLLKKKLLQVFYQWTGVQIENFSKKIKNDARQTSAG